jgi:CBS domain containing-hemolysin-like protein
MEYSILLILILLNGLFAMSEMAVVSSRKVRLQQWADDGRPGARAALALANNPSHFLSTIQVGITVIGVTSGAFGEATFAEDLSDWLSRWPLLDRYSEPLALAVVVTGITVASLIAGELVPKRLALLSAERIASTVARPMQVLSRLTYPVVRVLSAVTDGILALFGARGIKEPHVTEEEINILMEQGTKRASSRSTSRRWSTGLPARRTERHGCADPTERDRYARSRGLTRGEHSSHSGESAYSLSGGPWRCRPGRGHCPDQGAARG